MPVAVFKNTVLMRKKSFRFFWGLQRPLYSPKQNAISRKCLRKKFYFWLKTLKNAQTSEYSLKHLKPATYVPPLATYSVYDICHNHFWPTTGAGDAKNRNKKLAPPSLEPRIWGFGFWGFEFLPPNHSATRDHFELQIVRDPSRNSRPNNNKIKTCTANAGPKGFDSGLDLIST